MCPNYHIIRHQHRGKHEKRCKEMKRNATDEFLGDLLDNVAVVHASSVILECTFHPQAWLVIQPQIEIAPANSHDVIPCVT